MRYNPSGKVLFCSICSLTKAGGGNNEYDVSEGIASGLTPRLAGKLHWHRERVRRLVGETSEVTWQGVALPELEYTRRLARGRQHPFSIRHGPSSAFVMSRREWPGSQQTSHTSRHRRQCRKGRRRFRPGRQ